MKNTYSTYRVGIYCRLSRDDNRPGESMSIGNQRAMLLEYCKENCYTVIGEYIDDGISGLTFEREDFQRLISDIESGLINMVVTKDLSRLGRDYIQMGYYTEIYFPSRNVRYVAISDGYDTNKKSNDIAPFMNVLNDMYAKDISRKVKAAKIQRAKKGICISSIAPYGYKKKDNRLVIDQEAADVVKLIYQLAASGNGSVRIAQILRDKRIPRPSVYQLRSHKKSEEKESVMDNTHAFDWNPSSIGAILSNRVYLGELHSHKTEVVNYKTKERRPVPQHEQIFFADAHTAIVSRSLFDQVQAVKLAHRCPAKQHKENLFRGLLFCGCCGHPLSISKRQLKYREDTLYRCMHHFAAPKECPRTHAIYHSVLYPYLLEELRGLARSLRRRIIDSPITAYTNLDALTPEILHTVICRIEIGHLRRKTPLKRGIQIEWKL